MEQPQRARIQLCGGLVVELDARRVDHELPGRQGRLLLAYLAANRMRDASRDELVDALWPEDAPSAAEGALRALLSKLRRLVELEVRARGVRLMLPPDSRIDLEAAREAIHRAESAVALADWPRAWGASQVALFAARRGFLTGESTPWVEELRREVAELHVRSLEAYATACLAVRGTELPAAARAGRELIGLAPYRESGHRHLMAALSAQGNRAEAIRAYDALRVLLREELGVGPSAETQELHRRLLVADLAYPAEARDASE